MTIIAKHSLAVAIIVGGFVLVTSTAQGQERLECGTVLTQEDVAYVRAMIDAGMYDLPATAGSETIVVPMTMHVVRDSSGNGGLDEDRVAEALCDVNNAFTDAGIQFCQPSPTRYIDNDDFYENIDTNAEIDALRQTDPVPDTINVYFTESLANETACETPPCQLCGKSSLTNSPVQGIVMANGCTATDDNHSTFPHEVGHYFDLLHTHETANCPECANGSNCSACGDLLCDTPADPKLGTGNVNTNCAYTGNETDSCNNDPYAPDPANLMSNSRKACRTSFTAAQDNRALATLLNLRPELVHGSCPVSSEQAKLTASDAAEYVEFGASVSVSGDTALVGAAYDDCAAGNECGSAYVYRFNGTSWVEEQKLTASDAAANDEFGRSVSVSGDTAVVGAFWDDCAAGASCGS
ncbi:MAG: hypothetical protein IID36_03560, partial [Planctomycetes bacterium]|nr:hypothetical protein [Planctomycetota bacterium]